MSTPINTLRPHATLTPWSQRTTPVFPKGNNDFLMQQWEEARKRGEPGIYANFLSARPVSMVRRKLNNEFRTINVNGMNVNERTKRMRHIKARTGRTRRTQRNMNWTRRIKKHTGRNMNYTRIKKQT